MAIPRSVNRLVNWLRVLPRLGVAPRTSVLPSVTDCPLCGCDRLYMYQDTLFGGEWHHCRGCHSTGDMISLAARYWKTDVTAAAARLLEDEGDPDGHGQWVAGRERADGMVATALKADSTRLKPVLQKLFLTLPNDRDRWAARLGRFVGVAHKTEVEYGLLGRSPDGLNRIFYGRGWGDVLVVPFYDLPGRLRGVWAHGRDGESVYRPLPEVSSAHWSGEAGLAFLDAALTGPDPDFGQTVFVVNDVLAAVRVHDKHFQQSARPLPLLACHAHGRLWARLDNHILAGRKLVFWGPRTTRELIRQAKVGDGFVTTGDGVRESVERHLGRYSAKAWLRFVEDNAEHWTLALERYLAELPDPEVEAVLAFMEFTADERRRLETAVSPAARDRLRRLHGQTGGRRIYLDNSAIIESNGHWYAVGMTSNNGRWRLITDAPFRVERVIQYPDQDRTDYEIVATFEGQEVPFVAPAREFERNPLEYVRDQVRRAGLGLVSCGCHWVPRAMAIATQFRKPEFVRGAERCGWNEALNGWVFERFMVSARGEVSTDRTVRPAGRLRPTAGLEPPGELHPDDVELLSRTDEPGKVVWATVACVLTNLVAPVANRETAGTALSGEGATFLGMAVARMLGCAEARAFGLYGPNKVAGQVACELERETGWPLVMLRVNGYKGYHLPAWLASDGPRNAVIDLDPVVALGVGARGGWNVIECRRPFASAAEYRRALPLVTPAFLKWFAERGLVLDQADTFGASVLDALSDWFAGLGGDPLAVSAARDVVRFDHGGRESPAVERFGDLLCGLAASGALTVGGERGKTPFLEYIEGNGLFIPAVSLNKLLASKGAPALDTPAVTRALAETYVLVAETDRGEPGWVVGREWWDRRYEQWRRIDTRRTA